MTTAYSGLQREAFSLPMRSLCLTQRDFLGFFEGINLGGKIQSRRHAEQEPEPGHDAVAITNAHSCPALSELSRSDLVLLSHEI